MFRDNKDFYPTPEALSRKMLEKVQFKSGMKVLEPSAGKGDLAAQLVKEYERKIGKTASRHSRVQPIDLDVIERDANLQNILRGQGYKLIDEDFLKNKTEKWYDLIIMNPPFSDGVHHVLKAIEMISKGGQLVALLNASNIKQPNSVYEKDLVRKIIDYKAEVDYLEGEFATSETERKTNVEVALIYFDIKPMRKKSVIVDKLKKDIEIEKANEEVEESDDLYAVVVNDMVQSIVDQYQFEVKAGLRMIDEFYSAKKHFLNDFEEKGSSILKLTLSSDRDFYHTPKRKTLRNSYIKEVRAKYWNAIFSSREFESLFTSKVRSDYRSQIEKLVDYDFNVFNILQIQEDLSRTVFGSIEEAIVELFEEFSHKHYYDESSRNVYLYSGWKTNKSYKVNKKVIIPLNAYNSWNNKLEYDYRVRDKMNDLEKALSYLDAKPFDPTVLENALKDTTSNKIETSYYNVIFYKKGTAHIQFKDEKLLKRFNIIGSMLKGWLPPSYGEKKYEDMNAEEKEVIKSFEGKASYNEVLEDKGYFLEQPRDRKLELPSEGFMRLAYTEEEPEETISNEKPLEEQLSEGPVQMVEKSVVVEAEVVEEVVVSNIAMNTETLHTPVQESVEEVVNEVAVITAETIIEPLNTPKTDIVREVINGEALPTVVQESVEEVVNEVAVITAETIIEPVNVPKTDIVREAMKEEAVELAVIKVLDTVMPVTVPVMNEIVLDENAKQGTLEPTQESEVQSVVLEQSKVEVEIETANSESQQMTLF